MLRSSVLLTLCGKARSSRLAHERRRPRAEVLFTLATKNDAADDYHLTKLSALPTVGVESDVLWIDIERQLQQMVLDAVGKIVTDEPEYRDFHLHRQQYI